MSPTWVDFMNLATSSLFKGQPAELPRSSIYTVTVDGQGLDVLDAGKADFAVFECRDSVEVVVETVTPAAQIAVRPFSCGIQARTEDRVVRFTVSEPKDLCIDVPGQKPLFLYVNGPERNRPLPDKPGVRFYASGAVYEVGRLELQSGETLYIEGGAVVRGTVVCRDAKDVTIRGRGILDGSLYEFAKGDRVRSIVIENCQGVLVEDIIMIHPTSWMLVLARSEKVVVRQLRQIGSCISSDGIDICGSKDVLIEKCCLRNEDDNIAIKSVQFPGVHDWRGDVTNIHVRDCVFLNGFPGNVMEIGYELSAERVSHVVFENIDVLNAHGEGAVFSIHNGDRALVENITWKNIRVEHYWDKLVDFRVVYSRYNRDQERGRIRNILLKDIYVAQSYYNSGCSASLVGGYDSKNTVEDVRFENIFFNDQKIANADQFDLFTRNVKNIVFVRRKGN